MVISMERISNIAEGRWEWEVRADYSFYWSSTRPQKLKGIWSFCKDQGDKYLLWKREAFVFASALPFYIPRGLSTTAEWYLPHYQLYLLLIQAFPRSPHQTFKHLRQTWWSHKVNVLLWSLIVSLYSQKYSDCSLSPKTMLPAEQKLWGFVCCLLAPCLEFNSVLETMNGHISPTVV